MKIHIFGVSGSGTTTLGHLLANEFGDRILQGGDMFDEHEFFIKWAKQYEDGTLSGRSRNRHEQFIDILPCPVIRLRNEGSLEDFKRRAIIEIKNRL